MEINGVAKMLVAITKLSFSDICKQYNSYNSKGLVALVKSLVGLQLLTNIRKNLESLYPNFNLHFTQL